MIPFGQLCVCTVLNRLPKITLDSLAYFLASKLQTLASYHQPPSPIEEQSTLTLSLLGPPCPTIPPFHLA
jgi:hypothetical protein